MINKRLVHFLKVFFERYSRWFLIVILAGLILVVNLFLFPLFHPGNEERELFDSQFSYSVERAYEIVEPYNAKERQAYILGHLTVDLVFPVIYSLFLSLLVYRLSLNVSLSLLPFLGMAADFLENIGIIFLLSNYSYLPPALVRLTSFFTSLKWLFLIISLINIFILLFMKLADKLKKKW